MGKMEEEVKKQVRATKLQHAILTSIKAAGILSVALLAPNAFRMFEMLGGKKWKQKLLKSSAARAVSRLADAGLVVFENAKNGKTLRLTEKGRQKLSLAEARNFRLKKPKRWDNKWRMVIFDIQEDRKVLRNTLRDTLRQVGFTKLQHSVWVYPYDCEDLIVLLKTDCELGREVLYVIADKIENDRALRQTYNLQ